MALNIPYSFDTKHIPDDVEMFYARWLNPNDYDWLYVLYIKQAAEKGFFGSPERFVAIAVEYVSSHWGIQKACTGWCDYKSIMKEEYPCQFLKLDPKNAKSKFTYDMETHVMKKWSLSYERDKILKLHRFSDYKPHEN